MALQFDASDIEEARRWNEKLAIAPRFRVRGRLEAAGLQAIVHLQQLIPHFYRWRLGVKIETRRIRFGGVRVKVRILYPPGDIRGVYLDIHGGGWIVGNAQVDDPVNALIAAECGAVVVSVDYRLARVNRLDRCIEDCLAAANWLVAQGENEFGVSRFVIGGESAGAHLAACTLLHLREDREALARVSGAVLFYGAYDLGGSPSVREAGPETLVLHGPTIQSGLHRLTSDRTDEERRAPDISPLYADLSNLPPALFLVGKLDPLIDDSTQMAERWEAANGNAELVVAPEAPHAFNRFGTHMAEKTNAYARAWIRRHFAGDPG